MTVQRIDNPVGHTHGWQARAHVSGSKRLTRFFADDRHGGQLRAQILAKQADEKLQRQAAKLKRRNVALT